MPLLSGKKNIGHNVTEMEAAGHPKNQSVAAALHEAYDKPSKQKGTKMRDKKTKKMEDKKEREKKEREKERERDKKKKK